MSYMKRLLDDIFEALDEECLDEYEVSKRFNISIKMAEDAIKLYEDT